MLGYQVSIIKMSSDKKGGTGGKKQNMYGKFASHEPDINIFRYSVIPHEMYDQFNSKLTKGIYKIVHHPCPICGGVEFVNVAISKECFKWGVCKTCGLFQMNGRLRDDDLNMFYESGEYQVICMGNLDDNKHFMLEYKVMSLYFFDVLEKINIPVHELNVLEIGCGSGGILLAFKEKGAIVKGYDLDPHRIEYGRRYISEIEYADAMEFTGEWPDNINLLILSNVLEHLADPQKFMKAVQSKLKNGNIKILIDIPNLDGAFAYSNQTFSDFLHIGHLWYFNSITIERLLNQAGLRIEFIFNRGAAFTIICSKSKVEISNVHNAFWNSISSINYANFTNEPGNVGYQASEAVKEICSSK